MPAGQARGAATLFMYTIAKILIAALSIPLLAWGPMILFSDKYFARWQNTAWRERDSKQWSPENVKFNRYGRGLRAIITGAVLLFSAVSQLEAVPSPFPAANLLPIFNWKFSLNRREQKLSFAS
jgi:hypothetical protein